MTTTIVDQRSGATVVTDAPEPGRAVRVTVQRVSAVTAPKARPEWHVHPVPDANIPEPTTGEIDVLRAALNEIASLPGGEEMARVTLVSGVSFVGVPDVIPQGGLIVQLRRTNGSVGHTVRLPVIAGVSRAFQGRRSSGGSTK